MWIGNNPITLDEDEALNAFVAENLMGAEQEYVLVWLGDGPVQPVGGEIFTVRVTNTTTLVADAWTNGAITFDQTLPVGDYQIVGARFSSAGLIAFRFVFVGGNNRPGGLGVDAAGDLNAKGQRHGGWGVWGDFRHNRPPTADFLSISADTSQTGELDLIKVV